MDFWLPIVVVFVANLLFGIFCQIVKDNSWIDVWWGWTFVFPNVALIIKKFITGEEVVLRVWIVLACVTIWALRLSLHIGLRHTREDFRYVDMRQRWTAEGKYYIKTFAYIFGLQGLFSIIANAAALYVTIYSASNELIWLDYLGAAIWLFGFIFEWVGDQQLKSHIADKTPGKKKFIAWGLWRYTRHPNYFGEAVLWWGVFLITCAVQWGFVTFFAPLFVTYLVRFLSGVPMLEEKYKDNPEWIAYCEETNVFAPWFVSKRKEGSMLNEP